MWWCSTGARSARAAPPEVSAFFHNHNPAPPLTFTMSTSNPYYDYDDFLNEPALACNADAGRNPSWNEVLRFQINSSAANGQDKLVFRIMDHDTFSRDDFLGQAT